MDQFLPILPTKNEFWTSNRFKKAMKSALPYLRFKETCAITNEGRPLRTNRLFTRAELGLCVLLTSGIKSQKKT